MYQKHGMYVEKRGGPYLLRTVENDFCRFVDGNVHTYDQN